jgi:hypothetical protein
MTAEARLASSAPAARPVGGQQPVEHPAAEQHDRRRAQAADQLQVDRDRRLAPPGRPHDSQRRQHQPRQLARTAARPWCTGRRS